MFFLLWFRICSADCLFDYSHREKLYLFCDELSINSYNELRIVACTPKIVQDKTFSLNSATIWLVQYIPER